jgi:GNAT superfamily N-acetyltransferase
VFHEPFPLNTKPEMVETPGWFKQWRATVEATLPTYRILERCLTEGGAVAEAVAFEDSPDAEFIASGISGMGPDHPAIARHGRYVMWGFHGSPEKMTETGRRLLLNVIAYADRMRDAELLVRRQTAPRAFARVPLEDRDYVHGVPGEWLRVDPDARRLGVPNNSAAFLEAIRDRLRRDPADALAHALRERYVPQAPKVGFVPWLDANRELLFFSDWGGYRWLLRR